MSGSVPDKIMQFVIGLDGRYNFVNVVDPANPVPLRAQLTEPCLLVFSLGEQLIEAGWTFQGRPIDIDFDFGANFSSFVWVGELYGVEMPPRTCFKVVYECARMGEYTYSLQLQDSKGQKLRLDPVFDNGTGQVP